MCFLSRATREENVSPPRYVHLSPIFRCRLLIRAAGSRAASPDVRTYSVNQVRHAPSPPGINRHAQDPTASLLLSCGRVCGGGRGLDDGWLSEASTSVWAGRGGDGGDGRAGCVCWRLGGGALPGLRSVRQFWLLQNRDLAVVRLLWAPGETDTSKEDEAPSRSAKLRTKRDEMAS